MCDCCWTLCPWWYLSPSNITVNFGFGILAHLEYIQIDNNNNWSAINIIEIIDREPLVTIPLGFWYIEIKSWYLAFDSSSFDWHYIAWFWFRDTERWVIITRIDRLAQIQPILPTYIKKRWLIWSRSNYYKRSRFLLHVINLRINSS